MKIMESKYIKWDDLWEDNCHIYVDERDKDDEYYLLLKNFEDDDEIELMEEECILSENGDLLFFFSASAGQNESDTQGYNWDYTLIFNSEYQFKSIEYSQG